MAKGITEMQVHTAADALVAAGERPTVERIRAHLGTGSPNTVTRLLDSWWQALGARLTAQHAVASIPDAPSEIAALAGQWWARACQQAREVVEADVTGVRMQLANDRVDLDRDRELFQQTQTGLEHALTQAQQAETAMAARLADVQRLVEQQANQLADLTQQRDALQTRNERGEAECRSVMERLQAQETAATAERELLAQQLRAAEDPSHAEVDRARQESKGLRTRLSAAEKERTVERERHGGVSRNPRNFRKIVQPIVNVETSDGAPKFPSAQLHPGHERIQVDHLAIALEGVVAVEQDVPPSCRRHLSDQCQYFGVTVRLVLRQQPGEDG